MKTHDHRLTLALLFLSTLLTLVATGCHTAHGFGHDMEDAGEKIQEKTSH
jgi:predicted small secreted protein